MGNHSSKNSQRYIAAMLKQFPEVELALMAYMITIMRPQKKIWGASLAPVWHCLQRKGSLNRQ